MKKCFVLLVGFLFLFSGVALAEKVTIDKSELSKEQLLKLEASELKEKVDKYGSWVGIGKEVGVAVDSSLSAISKHAVEFAQTDAGKFTMFIVAYKVIGKDVLRLVIGLFVLIGAITLLGWSYWRTCIPRSVLFKVYPDKTKEYKIINAPTERPETDNMWGARITHGIFAILIGAVCAFIMFA